MPASPANLSPVLLFQPYSKPPADLCPIKSGSQACKTLLRTPRLCEVQGAVSCTSFALFFPLFFFPFGREAGAHQGLVRKRGSHRNVVCCLMSQQKRREHLCCRKLPKGAFFAHGLGPCGAEAGRSPAGSAPSCEGCCHHCTLT